MKGPTVVVVVVVTTDARTQSHAVVRYVEPATGIERVVSFVVEAGR